MGSLVKFFWCNDATDCKSSEITIPSQRLQQECFNAPGIKHGLCQFAYSSGMGSNDKWYSWQRSYPHCFYWSWYQSILLAYVVCMIPHIQLSSPSEKFWYRSFISQFQCFFSLIYRTMDSFLCFLNPVHYRFDVRTQSCTSAYILLGWLFCLAHRVEPITSSLCIRKTSFTGKTCYRHEVIISRKWIGPDKKILCLYFWHSLSL